MYTVKLRTALLISLIASLLMITGCEKDGPMERAGEKIDNATDDAGDAIDDARDKAGDALEDAADEVENATD